MCVCVVASRSGRVAAGDAAGTSLGSGPHRDATATPVGRLGEPWMMALKMTPMASRPWLAVPFCC